MYRVGIVGHTGRGDYGHDLDLVCRNLPGFAVVAVADPDPAGRARATEGTGATRAYASYREMLARENLDLLLIGTRWPDRHQAMLLAAIEARVPVYCEKPFVRTPEEADRVLAAASAAGVKIEVAHVARSFRALARIRAMVSAGAIGRLRTIRASGKCDRRGGGQDLFVLGTHLFDLMRYYVGAPLWVHARITQDGREITTADGHAGDEGIGLIAGDSVSASSAFADGVVGQFESLVAEDGSGHSHFACLLQGTSGTIAIRSHGDRQLYRYPRPLLLPGRSERWEPLDLPGHTFETSEDARDTYVRAHQRLVLDLVDAVREGREPISSGADARWALEMIMGAYASQLAGRRVAFPLENRAHPLGSSAVDPAEG